MRPEPTQPALSSLIGQAHALLRSDVDEPSELHALVAQLLTALLQGAASIGARDLRLGRAPAGAYACARCNGAGRDLAQFPAELLGPLCRFAGHCSRRPALGSPWAALCGRYRFETVLGSAAGSPTAFIRIIDRDPPHLALDAIGYETADLESIRRALHAPSGLVLVVGPAGSGRSTALYAMLELLDPVRRSIQTVESRIRRPVPRWLQFAVPDRGLRFSAWERRLRWVLRNGADAILLGKIASPGMAQLAIQAVQSGHLVLSTMAVGRACSVLTEFQRLHVPAAQLVDSLSLVIGQRLIGKLCRECAQPDDRELARRALASALNTWLADQSIRVRRASPAGCAHCGRTGYHGTTLAYELIEVDTRAQGLIGSGIDPIELESALLADGRTIWDRGLKRVADGTSSLDALQAALRQPR
jgi:type II secretory ATPase GspE/PulE/Tfp pilus assembly ATPase PilB-like protein